MKKILSAFILLCVVTTVTNAQVSKGKKQAKAEQKKAPEPESEPDEDATSKIDSLDNAYNELSQLSIGCGYLSNVAFQGRNYGIQQIGASPGIDLKLSNGLSFSLTGNFWSEASPKNYAETDIGVGYEFNISDKFGVNIGYERWIPTNPPNVGGKPLSSNFTTLGFNYDAGLIRINSTFFYIYTAGQTGSGASFSLTKAFEWQNLLGLDKLTIAPTASAEFGEGDIGHSAVSGKNGRIATTYTNIIKVINYQFDLPITYRKIGKYEIGPTLHYAIPQNTSVYEGSLTPFFYFSADLKINLLAW